MRKLRNCSWKNLYIFKIIPRKNKMQGFKLRPLSEFFEIHEIQEFVNFEN